MREMFIKTLGTSIIYGPISPSSLHQSINQSINLYTYLYPDSSRSDLPIRRRVQQYGDRTSGPA